MPMPDEKYPAHDMDSIYTVPVTWPGFGGMVCTEGLRDRNLSKVQGKSPDRIDGRSSYDRSQTYRHNVKMTNALSSSIE